MSLGHAASTDLASISVSRLPLSGLVDDIIAMVGLEREGGRLHVTALERRQ